ncbi:ABC transporter ATP-binding protein [Gracilibacillus marinus]|uniref:ABC transporter ATP-binding protein n=1 Tax=Gracilibacillus marinus TaxID=630535 RepID=A0ABV8VYU1_9BACI
MSTIIQSNLLCKEYKKNKALKEVNIEIEAGQVVGLLGKNGAGKTTLNKIITGLTFPSAGSIEVFGKEPVGGDKRIGFLSENIALYPHLSAKENLEISLLQNGHSPNRKQINHILDTVSIDNTRKKAKDFSLGMKRRLQVAMTILTSERDLLILDEPTNGLDLDGVMWLKKMVSECKAQGKTILLSSHSIEQMEDILTDYFILHKGNVVDTGKVDIHNNDLITLELKKEDLSLAIQLLDTTNSTYIQENTDLHIVLHHEYMYYLQILNSNGIYPIAYNLKRKTLVDRFHQFTGGEKGA